MKQLLCTYTSYICMDGTCTYFPTISCSLSVACFRTRLHISIVNTVAALLKTEVRELIRAASITAIIKPRMPKTTLLN